MYITILLLNISLYSSLMTCNRLYHLFYYNYLDLQSSKMPKHYELVSIMSCDNTYVFIFMY